MQHRTRSFGLVVVAACSVVLGGLVAIGPAAAAGPAWKGPVDISGGDPSVAAQAIPDPAGGALLYYSEFGFPTLQRVRPDGSLATATSVPGYSSFGNRGTPGHIAMLPSGGALVTWTLSSFGTDVMAYLSPSGKWGTAVKTADAVTSVAVRSGEVLTSEGGGGGITVDDWKLSPSGTLTHQTGPTTVFTGDPLFGQSWVTLDASGSAVVVSYGTTTSNSNEEVYQTVRKTATGDWGDQTSMTGNAVSIQNVVFAAAPGGRAVVAWQARPSLTAPVMSAAIHLPGKPFAAPKALSSPTSDYFAYAIPIVAAGIDGTLAVAVSNEIGDGIYTSNYTTINSVWLVDPAATTFGASKNVPGTTNKFLISSLSAVKDVALVGIHEEKITDGEAGHPDSYRADETTTAARVPATGKATIKNFASSSGLYDGNGSDGCTSCDGTSPPGASVTGVAISAHAVQIAVGQLKPGGNLSYAVLAAAVAPTPVVSIASTKTKAKAHSVSVAVKCAKAPCKGSVTLTPVGKSKTLASGTYSLSAGKQGNVRLTLTKAGRDAFKHAGKKAVKAAAHATVKGGKSATGQIKVT